ncbi:ATP-binding protein [Mesorhizobium sp. SP-1A]|uniref:ATP-binding protein n=1 Tax=Mesorhizobium sp. SP-1A TaxID=3077840 RepID=UPI0028F6CFAA|nr:ATP-binding protein [Mesorhizobium sp. SP-1A]
MNERLARHLLDRLRRKAAALALADAVEAGILCQEDVESHGRVVSVYRRHPDAVRAMSPSQAVAMLSRHRRRLPDETTHPILGSDEFAFDTEMDTTPTAEAQMAIPGDPLSSEQARCGDLALVKAIRGAAEPPSAADVAVMLLLAQAVPDDEAALADVLQALRLRRPIVTLLGETKGFERTFLELLKRGHILPGAVERSNGYDIRYENVRFEHVAAARRRVVVFVGSDRGEEEDDRQYGAAAISPYPILAVAERKEALAPKLVQASQLNVACGTLTVDIVRRTIETVLGASPSVGKLEGIIFERLGLGDIAIAVRPGVAADMAADSLRRLAEAAVDAEGGEKDDCGRKALKGNSRSSDTPSSRRNADPGSGSDIIQPEAPAEASAGRPPPTIETLSGYGDARDWALQIRDVLPLWRAGDLAWIDMSTKVLLSGPPGVGKTHFARALCNTLQIPLLATSVARWLEPSHLGDVLKRMKRSFEEAETQKPCILFVDEFDGIGRRVDLSRDYADYWNSVVNCCLELLDGVARTSGVVVVCATNNPSVIDPALLRSGRIDRQIEIPLPDAEARLAILRHHLGKDIETVTASVSKAVLVENDLRKVLEEGFEMMSDKPYAGLVQAAIPIRTEAPRP